MTRYASRKFILAFATLVACTWLVSEFVIDADTFKTIVLGTVGIYIAGNVGQKAWSKE